MALQPLHHQLYLGLSFGLCGVAHFLHLPGLWSCFLDQLCHRSGCFYFGVTRFWHFGLVDCCYILRLLACSLAFCLSWVVIWEIDTRVFLLSDEMADFCAHWFCVYPFIELVFWDVEESVSSDGGLRGWTSVVLEFPDSKTIPYLQLHWGVFYSPSSLRELRSCICSVGICCPWLCARLYSLRTVELYCALHCLEMWPSSVHCEQVVSSLRQCYFVCPMRWQVRHRIGLGRYASISLKCQLIILVLLGKSGLLNVIMYRWVGSSTSFTFLFIVSIFIACWSDMASSSSSLVKLDIASL